MMRDWHPMALTGSLALIDTGVSRKKEFVSATALQVELLTSVAEFEALAEAWDALLEQNATQAYFLRWSWNRLWWQTYAPAGSRLYLLACHDSEGTLLGLAPLYWQPRSFAGVPHVRELNFIGMGAALKTSEHLDILAKRGFERAVAEAIATFLQARNDWDRLHLWNVPDRSQVLPHLQKALGVTATECDHPHYISTDTDWETLRRTWARKFRYNIERCTRNLSKTHEAVFARVASSNVGQSELDATLDDFVRLHQMRWTSKGHAGSFTFPQFEAFLRTAIQQAFEDGRLRFWSYKLDGQCVATLVAFVENGVAHYFQGGFDPAYSKHSLGSVMVAQCLQDCVADPTIHEFDFMGGGSAYKDSWTEHTRTAFELEAFQPGWRTLLYQNGLTTRRWLGRMRRTLRQRVTSSS
jgi:CelD/BcsL family acetyltransferase involved in cellulose biosynthesis